MTEEPLFLFIINKAERESEVLIQEAPRVNIGNHVFAYWARLDTFHAGNSASEQLAHSPDAGWLWVQAEALGQA